MYNPERYKEKELLAEGTEVKAIVEEIQVGKLTDFVQNIENWKAEPTAQAILIRARATDGQVRSRTMLLPEDDEIHPQSNLAKWRKKYGDFPKEGQEIVLVADKDGFLQFEN